MNDREKTKAMIAVMQHFADGGEIQLQEVGADGWITVHSPSWSWNNCNYRISKLPVVEIPAEQRWCGNCNSWSVHQGYCCPVCGLRTNEPKVREVEIRICEPTK